MSHGALLEYIRKAKDRGVSDRDIADRLYRAGWYRVDIQDALELYRTISRPRDAGANGTPLAAPAPTLSERLVPHSYDPHLIAVAVVSFVIGFLGYLWLTR